MRYKRSQLEQKLLKTGAVSDLDYDRILTAVEDVLGLEYVARVKGSLRHGHHRWLEVTSRWEDQNND